MRNSFFGLYFHATSKKCTKKSVNKKIKICVFVIVKKKSLICETPNLLTNTDKSNNAQKNLVFVQFKWKWKCSGSAVKVPWKCH